MALVVTARAPLEAPPGIGQSARYRARFGRLETALRWAAVGGAAWYSASLVVDSLTRFAAPDGLTELGGQVIGTLGLLGTLAVAVLAWLVRRDDAALLLAATLAPVLGAVRTVSAGLLLTLDQATTASVLDVGLGLVVLGCLVWSATAALCHPTAVVRAASPQYEFFRRVLDVTVLVVVGVGVTGATVRAVGASWACQGTFPDCNGLGVLPFGRDPLADIQLYHRLLAYVCLGLVGWVAIEAFRTHRHLARLSLSLLGTTVVQAAVGVAAVSSANPTLTQALHTAGSAATVSAAVVLAVMVRRAGQVQAVAPADARGTTRVLAAYIQLTKPKVMSLLLATTATAMVIAARGMPDLGVFLATLLGGALMSGGAGAINHYVDRDIDPLMGRTAWRPIPSGAISPARALWFGIGLAVLASAIFIAFVNPLACLLALLGLLGYVFIYTLWLKRTTPSNIVIGGAAGAIPPLVGWAAVTGEVSSLTAWYLFAIIFFWTPPHFWALSLLIRQHYERAGIPMLPVVRGEDETRRQIVLYSVLLVVLTLVLAPFGMMGWLYSAAAIVLGGLFIRGAVVLWRRGTREAARGLYLYSMLYLFALFAAMAVDRVVVSA